MTRASFHAHLADSRLVAAKGDEWTIGLSTERAVDWVSHRLAGTLETLTRSIEGRPICLRFVVAPVAPVSAPPLDPVPAGTESGQLSFAGFAPPAHDFTQVPNQFFTDLVPVAPPTATAFALAVVYHSLLIVSWRPLRRAEWWVASYAQIASACGISRAAVKGAVAWACDNGFVVREAIGQSWRYRLRYENDPPTPFEPVDNPAKSVDKFAQTVGKSA